MITIKARYIIHSFNFLLAILKVKFGYKITKFQVNDHR